MVKRKLFITGEKRIGKSSLIKKMVEPHRRMVAGFFTQRICVSNGETRAFRLVDLSSQEDYQLETHGRDLNGSDLNHNLPNIFIKTTNKGIYYKDREVFNRVGADILTSALQRRKSLIVLDEIGRIEEEAKAYKEALDQILNSDCHILGVLQKRGSKLVSEIGNRNDVVVLELDHRNSNKIEGKISEFITEAYFSSSPTASFKFIG